MYSLWHLCLYGFGKLPSIELVDYSRFSVFNSAIKEFISRLLSVATGAKHFGPASLNDSMVSDSCLKLRYFYYQLHLAKNGACISNIDFVVPIGKASLNYDLSDDRSKYEFLATYSMVHSMPKFTSGIECNSLTVCGTVLDSIDDPFLYSRAGALLALASSLVGEKDMTGHLAVTCSRFLQDFKVMESRKSDGVHSSSDYIVFSASLLGHALLTMGSQRITCYGMVESLSKVADHYFHKLDDSSKASQFTFYNLFKNKCEVYDIEKSSGVFIEVVESFCRKGDLKSRLAYLRAAYLLVEAASSNFYIHSIHVVSLIAILVRRLGIIGKVVPASSISYAKYDNDILCFCYAFVVAHYYPNKELVAAIEMASYILSGKVANMSDADLFKLLNCCIPHMKKT